MPRITDFLNTFTVANPLTDDGKRADKTVVKLLFTTAILLAAGTCCPGAETGCSDGMAAPSRSALTRPEDTYRKTGFSFTPIPALSYSSDLGFQLGAILDAYWFGDGSTIRNTGIN